MLGCCLFGWWKSSKCKKVIKKAQCRLKLLKSKRNAIVRQSREDVAELIKNGHEQTALNRVEQLIKDESLAAAYELLDQFCEFILVNLSYIRKHKDCPNDINEAVSSLIFASARFGDLPELRIIRKLFGERYGQRFATTAVELSHGNLVNHQLKEKLSVKSVTDDQKYRVVDEIARDYSIHPEILALDYYPGWQLVQVKEKSERQVVNKDPQINQMVAVSDMSPPEVEEIERDVTYDDSSTKNSLSKSSDTAIISTVQQYPPFFMVSPLQKKEEKVENCAKLNPLTTVSGLEERGERPVLSLSIECLPPFPKEKVVFHDDIEEYQFFVSKDGACQDQRLFKFRSSGLSSREKIELDWDQSVMYEEESPSEKSCTGNSRKSRREPEKISRRRSASLENQGIMDIGCKVYYQKPCRRYQKPLAQGIPQSSYAQKRLKRNSSSEMERNSESCKRTSFDSKICDVRLDYPSYICVCDNKDCVEALSGKPKRGTRAVLGFHKHIQQEILSGQCYYCQSMGNGELNEVVEFVSIPRTPNRRNHNGAAVYNVFAYPDCQTDEKEKETKADISESLGSFADSNDSCTRTASSLKRIGTAAPYSRAITLPPERPKGNKDKMLRSTSCPSPHPRHVHPKLPDYDDIAARFTALKRERLQNICIPEEKH
ncbi:hypothetical protein L6164_018728 [Bauhinia variegata]|uniref:Uncharacterized protein n=1 Tax=Bauhinia variegata TaxID=167791 RepID=A0ACB9NDU6_BAUVA|nr:hypothetical protein L6164_018728 [Bauhinia variegata]